MALQKFSPTSPCASTRARLQNPQPAKGPKGTQQEPTCHRKYQEPQVGKRRNSTSLWWYSINTVRDHSTQKWSQNRTGASVAAAAPIGGTPPPTFPKASHSQKMLCLTTRAPDLKLLYCGTVRQTLSQAEGSSVPAAPLVSLHRPPLLFGSSNGHPVLYAPLDQARTPLHLHRAVHIAGAKALGFRSGQVRSGSQSPCLRQSSPGAAGAEAGHAQTPTSPVT